MPFLQGGGRLVYRLAPVEQAGKHIVVCSKNRHESAQQLVGMLLQQRDRQVFKLCGIQTLLQPPTKPQEHTSIRALNGMDACMHALRC